MRYFNIEEDQIPIHKHLCSFIVPSDTENKFAEMFNIIKISLNY